MEKTEVNLGELRDEDQTVLAHLVKCRRLTKIHQIILFAT